MAFVMENIERKMDDEVTQFVQTVYRSIHYHRGRLNPSHCMNCRGTTLFWKMRRQSWHFCKLEIPQRRVGKFLNIGLILIKLIVKTSINDIALHVSQITLQACELLFRRKTTDAWCMAVSADKFRLCQCNYIYSVHATIHPTVISYTHM